jgi:TPR repeat protein
MQKLAKALLAAVMAFLVVLVVGRTASYACLAVDDKGNYSPTEHVHCLRQEADQGSIISQVLLGHFYKLGDKGVPQDFAEAAKWYRLAADQGAAGAQYMLGSMYALSEGVPLDLVRAHMWLNLAASQGYEEAVEGRELIAKKMTPAQIAEAQKLARDWKPKR